MTREKFIPKRSFEALLRETVYRQAHLQRYGPEAEYPDRAPLPERMKARDVLKKPRG